MSEHHKQTEDHEDRQEQSFLLSEIKKIQQHLVFLEKKIDMLVGGQTGGGRPSFNRERNFSKPNRPFGQGRPQRSHDGPPRGDREFGGQRRSFEGGNRFEKGPRKEHGGSGGGGGDFPRRKKQWRPR